MPTFYNYTENGNVYSFDDVFVPAEAFYREGQLWVWGNNTFGQLGTNDLISRSTPSNAFLGGIDWKQISSGFTHTAAVKNDGTLWIWGNGANGQLGTNDLINRSTPVTTFAGGTNWAQVSAGYRFTAAVKTDGTLWTWGNGTLGRLGNNSTTDRSTPVTTFSGGTTWSEVSLGSAHAIATKTDATLWAWGNNTGGQLGRNSIINSSVPVSVFGQSLEWAQISPNGEGGVKTDGTLWVWGSGLYGVTGSSEIRYTPVTTFGGATTWKHVDHGTNYTIGLKTDGTLWVWGSQAYLRGAFGLWSASVPITTFAGGTNWADTATTAAEDLYTLSATNIHTAAIKTDGTLWIWGNGANGRLGTNDTITRSTPVTVFGGGTNWKNLSMGVNSSAAIKTDGTLWTWGAVIFGQLGRKTSVSAVENDPVLLAGNNWADTATTSPDELYTISAGTDFTAALKTDGTLWVFGQAGAGRLGTNDVNDRSTPVTTFIGGTNWKQVSSGVQHTAAIKTDGTLWIWGNGTSGKLGTNDTINRSTPVTTFAGGTNWKQVSSGSNYTAAIKTDGTLWTWGLNTSAQLGRPQYVNYLPVPETTFAGGTNWADTATTASEELYTLSAGINFSTAIKTDGTLWVWGVGSNVRLGTNDIINRSTPVTTFAGGTDWKQVSTGYHTAAIKTDGTLWTWGSGGSGRLGTNDTINRSTPVTTFAGGTNWKQVSSGHQHTAAIKTDGTLWTWGYGGAGRLGNNATTNRSTPVTTFAGGTNWKQVSAGNDHTAAIKTDGTLWTWGTGSFGQHGTNATISVSTPVTTFAGGTNWKQVSASWRGSVAVKTDGTLWIWGAGTSGRLGTNDTTNRLTPVTTFAGGTDWKQVSASLQTSGNFVAAVKTDGTLWTWGLNDRGQLGTADTNNRSTPVTTFAGGTNWKQVSVGEDHVLALKDDGVNKELYVFGDNSNGDLGINGNDNTSGSIPIQVFGRNTDWKQVSASDTTTFAVKTDGTLWGWGDGNNFKLGRGTLTDTETPVTTFTGGTNWKQVSSGFRHTAAVKTDGTLWTWGNNVYGELGRPNTILYEYIPVTTFAGGNNWSDTATTNPEDLYTISAGGDFTAALKTDGTLWVFGQAGAGRLGTNDVNDKSTPVTTFAGGTNWKQISAGDSNTAAIKTDGTLWIWGRGVLGLLGTNETTDRSTPVTTFAGGTDWKQVSVGNNHTAAIKTDGTLWVWGNNTAGRLGTNDVINRSTPVTTFAGGTNWKQVSAGNGHTAAIKTDGTLWTWGDPGLGQLGRPTTTNYEYLPVTTFAGGNNWSDTATGAAEELYTLSAGVNFSAALKTDGTLWTWGLGTSGQLGDNTITTVSTPVTTFAGGTDWKQVSVGNNHTAAIKTDGTLWTWGNGVGGKLGTNDTTNRLTPVTTFAGGTDWKQVSSGYLHTTAIKTDGTLWVWGVGTTGRLGTNDATNRSTPVTTFIGGTDWKQVSAGFDHTAAIKTDGTLWAWGESGQGALGQNSVTDRSTPVTTFAGGTDWKQVSAGLRYTAAVKTDGTLWTFGQNTLGKLGDNSTTNRATPITTFAGGTDWKQVSASISITGDFTAAVKTDGTLWTWGNGTRGQLGNAQIVSRSTPVTTIIGGTDWKQVSVGDNHVLALKDDGVNKELYVFGDNATGELGINIHDNSQSIPIQVFPRGFAGWKQVTAGNGNTLAVRTDGTLWAWGDNTAGKLGDNSTTNRATPITTFAGGTDWKQVSTSLLLDHTAAVKTDGTLWTWGIGSRGQLGNTIPNSRSTPVTTFAGGTNWKQVSAGNNHTIALKDDGVNKELYVFGDNDKGELGINAYDYNNNSIPLQVFPKTSSDWKQVTVGSDNMAAVKTDGTLWVWGDDGTGQLGTGGGSRITPSQTSIGGTNWKQVHMGANHTVALKDDGTTKELYVWGNAPGLGINVDPNVPLEVIPNDFEWKNISLGNSYAAAIKTDGTLWAWGDNTAGKLGDNSITGRATPITTFAGGTDWKQVSAGNNHTAAVKTDGTLWTWGINSFGELGVNDTITRSTPVTTFSGGTNWKQVSCGTQFTTAIKTDGTLWTWGAGTEGQLGINATTNRSTPVTTFAGGTNWKQVSSGLNHTAAVKDDGTLWVWGNGLTGELGNATLDNSLTPITTFVGGTNWKQVSAANNHTVALKDDGVNKELYIWGDQVGGILGNFVGGTETTPVPVFGNSSDWKQMTAAASHVSAVKTDGTLWTWGGGTNGILGINAEANRSTPVTTFAGGINWKQVSTGNNHTAAIKTDGTLWIWGAGTNGRLGTNDTTNRSTPVTTFAGGTNWKQVHMGANHTVALKTDGTLWTWGVGAQGQLGINATTNRSTPVTTFAGGINWTQVIANNSSVTALKTDGTLWVWGDAALGKLGTNDTIDRSTPVTTFAGGTNWKDTATTNPEDLYTIAVGKAIKTDGTLWTWGLNSSGELGVNDSVNRSTPVTVFVNTINWRQAYAGESHNIAIKTDGTLWVWGNGALGRLGTNDTINRSTPVTTFAGGINWTKISAGDSHTAAIKTDGTLWIWGLNRITGYGMLGTNDTIDRSTPVTTFAGGTNWKKVSAGNYNTAAIKTDGSLWTWGGGGDGQLGNNSVIARSTPITTFAGSYNWKEVSVGAGQIVALTYIDDFMV